MKLSKTSMLYRSAKFQGDFLSEYGFQYPNDLCTFLRQYLFGALWKSLVVFLVGVLLTGSLLDIFIFIVNWFHAFDVEGTPLLMAGAITLGIIALMAIVLGVVFGGYWIRERYDEYKYKSGEKEPGLIKTYLHSRKHKYCANIEYVE
jgi:hypothetical protein